ncbi:MAG TPA: LptF/LptG family permease [Longimicrobiales bacterium]|nr:LptF/LptG family permease [Longimicrobiales bacterium]
MRMGVLTRYLIRAHLGPFIFSLSAITGLIFLNAVALRIESLVGKGLSWKVIVEFLYLSLPHTIALSLPMAVLVAVLYAFSELTENNEITAMAAGGIRPTRVLLPLLGMGMVAAMGMLYFNDSVLPEANHRLKNLLMDIGRKSPTFELREQVVNEIETNEGMDHYFLTADRIDRSTNTLENVTIFDRNNTLRQRTTYAARGVMAFNEARTDLYLTLYDGEVRETQGDREGGFQHVYFQKQIVPLRGVGDELDRRMGGSDRGDREMDFATLREEARARDAERAEVLQRGKERSVEAVRIALSRPVGDEGNLVESFRMAQSIRLEGAARENATLLSKDPVTQNVVTATRTYLTQAQSLAETANRFRVELHKKWAIALACLVFTLIGPPLALRFPRGGVGMVVAASTGIFAIYWMGLIGGESLADRQVASPVVTMWISNVVFTLVGLLLVSRMGRAGATVRGGGRWEEVWLRVRDRLTGLNRSRPGSAA